MRCTHSLSWRCSDRGQVYAPGTASWVNAMDAWKKTTYPLPQSWEESQPSDDRKDGRYGLAFVSLLVAVPVLLIALVVLAYSGFAVAS